MRKFALVVFIVAIYLVGQIHSGIVEASSWMSNVDIREQKLLGYGRSDLSPLVVKTSLMS